MRYRNQESGFRNPESEGLAGLFSVPRNKRDMISLPGIPDSRFRNLMSAETGCTQLDLRVRSRWSYQVENTPLPWGVFSPALKCVRGRRKYPPSWGVFPAIKLMVKELDRYICQSICTCYNLIGQAVQSLYKLLLSNRAHRFLSQSVPHTHFTTNPRASKHVEASADSRGGTRGAAQGDAPPPAPVSAPPPARPRDGQACGRR